MKGTTGDGHRHLIEALEADISLVMIDGIPRYGTATLMNRFVGPTETATIAGKSRRLNLVDTASSPLVAALTYASAAALRNGMANLPTLAQEVDTAIAMAGFSGAADGSGETWQMPPDFEAEEEALAAQAAAMGIDVGSDDLADWVTEPMTLDGITVADDKGHLPALVHALNLPDFVKKGLPKLYGQTSSCPTAPSSSATPRFGQA